MGSTDVYILGQKYTIKGDESEEHVKELARYIDGQISEVCSKAPNITPVKALILAIFNIADELHKAQARHEGITSNIEQNTQALESLLEQIETS